MSITKEVIEIEETLKNKLKNILLFLNIKADIQNGSIISIDNTNLAYIEPHKLIINDITYLFFNKYKSQDLHDIADNTSREEEINDFLYDYKYDKNDDYDIEI